jgi:hypothetical protein
MTNQLDPDQLRMRAREIRDLCRQLADVRARDELMRISTEYVMIAGLIAQKAEVEVEKSHSLRV